MGAEWRSAIKESRLRTGKEEEEARRRVLMSFAVDSRSRSNYFTSKLVDWYNIKSFRGGEGGGGGRSQ